MQGRSPPALPRRVILVFGPRLQEHVRKNHRGVPRSILRIAPEMYVTGTGPGSVGVYFVRGVGGPQIAIDIEDLAELGVRDFLLLGLAGSLQPEVAPGSIVLCRRALRDEGTSHHYARSARFARPSSSLTRHLREFLRKERVPFAEGPSWTTDAFYRETAPELRAYRREGILTVEMEAATLFTVARYRGCRAAALFVVSDVLSDRGWRPKFVRSRNRLEDVLDLGVAAMRAEDHLSRSKGRVPPRRKGTRRAPVRSK